MNAVAALLLTRAEFPSKCRFHSALPSAEGADVVLYASLG